MDAANDVELSLFARLGRFCARRRRSVVGAWLLLLALAVPLAPQLPGALRSGGFSLDDLEASRARLVLESEIGAAPSAMVILFQSETDSRAGQPEFEAAVGQALARVPAAEHVAELLTHHAAPRQVSADGRTVYEVVLLDLPPDDSPLALEPVRQALTPVPGIRTLLAGGPAFYGDIQVLSEHDLQRSEFISLPLAALALLVVFGSVVAAGMPIVIGGTAVVVALALIFLMASVTPMSIFVLNLATLLGLGLGVDYALLLTSRFREELALRGGGRLADGRLDQAVIDDAVASTVATAGRAAFFSGLTVLLGLIGLILFEFMVLRSVGIAGAAVVGLAVAAAVTLLPACLAFLGPRIDSLRLPSLRRRRARPEGTPEPADGGWARLARRVMDRPLLFFASTLALLLLLGTPFLHVRFNAPDATILPPSVPSRQAYDLLVSEFGEGEFAPLQLAVRTPGPAIGPDNVAALYDYSRRLQSDPRVSRIESIVDLDPRLGLEQYQQIYAAPPGQLDPFAAAIVARSTREDLTSFTVVTPYGPNRSEAQALVDDLRDPASTLAPPPGMSVLVGGGAAEVRDVVARIGADFPRSAAFILVSTYLVLFVLLRSVVLPAKALIVNALSITASFGALVWIFQDGNLSALLGFTPLGFVETTLPVILFCVLFGLSMDYEVFLLSRMKEAYDKTGDNREAVARGMERSGRIVTSAALIVVVVAGSFAFADIVLIKALGLGVAIAVALDATVVRALLVPATMRLLGDRNWWLPDSIRRFISTRLHVPETATLALLALAVLCVGCADGRILANQPPVRATPPASTPTPSRPADPQPVLLPRDEAPHDRISEWWYYTGHLATESGREFGFEYVIFRAERGTFPVTWASHLALTDEEGGRFLYDQRSEIGAQVDLRAGDPSDGGGGFDLAITGGGPLSQLFGLGDASPAPAGQSGAPAEPWRMSGRLGSDLLAANSSAFGLDLQLRALRAEPVLHDVDGWIDYGPAGGSYYYSWPRMEARGSLALDGERLAVEGTAWFDHQWGDFITAGAGGWDWFAINLDDGTDLTVYQVRDGQGNLPLVYGTLVQPDGRVEHLLRDDFSVDATAEWTSPRTGTTYPAGWRVQVPGEQLVIDLSPTVADQELDTRATTGVTYWEGSQVVRATRAGAALGGEAYVELTGYATP